MNKSTQIYIQHAHLYINQASDPPFISIVNIYISYECVAPCKSARFSMLKDTQWQASENIARKSCKWVGSGCTARLHNILPQHLHYYIYMKILSNKHSIYPHHYVRFCIIPISEFRSTPSLLFYLFYGELTSISMFILYSIRDIQFLVAVL